MQIEITPEYLASQGLSKTFPQRFWSKVKKTESCWIWMGPPDSVGYGMIGRGPKYGGYLRSHRASWIVNRGRIPEGAFILHRCPGDDNKMCVNPNHLYIGDGAQNGYDRATKHCGIGKAGKRKLTKEDVVDIRTSTLSVSELSQKYGVVKHTIYRVINRTTWK